MAMRGWNRQLLFFISFIMLSGLYILVSMNKGRKIQHKRISVVNISVLSLDRVATIKDPIVAQPIIVFPEGNKGSQNGSFQPETLKRAREPLDENSASESDRDPKEQLKFSKRLPRGLNVSLTQHHEPIRPINLGSLQQQQSEERHRHSTRISLNTVASAEEQGDEEPSQKRRYYIEPTSIKSKPLSHDHVTEVLLVMVSKKEHHFAAFLRSLKRSDWPRDLLVVFSHDFYKSRTVSLAAGLKTAFRNTVQWFHPFACSEARPDGPGRGFPRYHLNGSEIFDWKGCCVKNHWWWAINKIWSWLPSLQILYYFEEDFLVAKNSYKAATMLRQKSEANNLFGFMLQCRHNLWTVSGGLLRSSWLEIQQKVDFFCSFNEYNWDLSIKQALIHYNLPTSPFRRYICPRKDYAIHIGKFGEGFTQGKKVTNDAALKQSIATAERKFYAGTDTLVLTDEQQPVMQTLSKVHKGFGGYSHQHYQDHCKKIHSYYKRATGKEVAINQQDDKWIRMFIDNTRKI